MSSPDLNTLGKKLIETFPRATRISIFTRAMDNSPLQEVWCNGEMGQIAGMDGERVLGTIEKWKQTVLVEDVNSNKLLKSIERHHFQSCLAVPVLDATRILRGVIYLTSTESKAFNTHGRFACEKVAKQAIPVLEKLHGSVAAEGEDEKRPFDFLLTPQVLVTALALLLLVGIGFFAAPTGEVEDSQALSQTVRASAKETAKDYLQRLRVGEFSQAWELLEPDLQKSWSREQFTNRMNEWTATEGKQLILLNREVAGVKVEGEQATAILFGTATEGDDGKQWDWELKLMDGRWRLSSVSGPVLIR